jgi:hypothetical protein
MVTTILAQNASWKKRGQSLGLQCIKTFALNEGEASGKISTKREVLK